MKFKRSGILTKIIIAALLIYATTTLVSMCHRISSAKDKQTLLQQEAHSIAADNAEMEYAIEHSEDDSVIEDIARDKLNLVMPDEKIFYAD